MSTRFRSLLVFSLLLFVILPLTAQITPPRELQGQFMDGKVILAWNKPDSHIDAAWYVVYRTANGGTTFSPIGSSPGPDSTFYSDHTVGLNAIYHYYVTAVGNFPDTVESGPSNIIEVHTGENPGPPQPPYGLEAFYVEGSVALEWHDPIYPLHPSFYKIYRHSDSDTAFSLIGTSLVHYSVDHTIQLNTSYWYKVTAVYHDTIESPSSNSAFVHTGRPLGPYNLEGHIENNFAALQWDRPENDAVILWYNVYRWTFHDSLPAVIGRTDQTQYLDTTIDLSGRYLYDVTAVYLRDSAESFPSNIIMLPNDEASIHFTSTPPHTAMVGQLYQYDADVVTNPPGHTVCFSLEHAPDGMTIDPATGLVQWTPVHAGIVGVEIKATICDSVYANAEQEFPLYIFSGNPGSISGTVRNLAGQGVPFVTIKLFDVHHGEFVMRARTDDSGQYSFPMVNPSIYFVRAKPDSELVYAAQWYDGVERIENATPVTVAESSSVTVNFTLQPSSIVPEFFPLSGTVRDDSSHPLSGARVLIFRIVHDRPLEDLLDGDGDDHELVHTAWTDENGSYSVQLRSGHYIVGAMMEGYFPQFFDHKSSPLDANVIDLQHDTTGIDFDLRQIHHGSGLLSGTLFSATDSARIRGLVVGFHKPAPDSAFSGMTFFTHTDTAGNYLLHGLPDGYYVVLALPRGEYVPTFYNTSGGTPFLDSATAVAVFSDSVGGINVYVQPDSIDGLNSVAGMVQTNGSTNVNIPSSLTPLPGVVVTVLDQSHAAVGSSITGSDGSYMATGLAPGSYTVTFQKPGKTTTSVPITVSYSNNTPTIATVDAQLSDAGSGQIGTMSVLHRWNLVSLPVTVADAHRSAVFPGAISEAFGYDGNGYVVASVLDYNYGYWLKFAVAQAFTVPGEPRTSQTIPIMEGWNLIGAISSPVATSSISTTPSEIITSNYFGFNGSYVSATSIQPGKGYWVKVSAAGTLTITAGTAIPKAQPATEAGINLNSMTISDAAGRSQVLYFGGTGNNIDVNKYEVPPLPPAEAFDVRFGSQRLIELHPATIEKALEYPVQVQSAVGAITITWSIRSDDASYSLADANGKVIAKMSGSGSATVQSIGDRLFLDVQGKALPIAYALEQNYPNPFNPTTSISFSLPMATNVTLKLYNLIGQEVATLIDGKEYEAGQHTVRFDATKLTSGIYFYRLQAGSFVSVRKMILMK
ncbi:MAG: carboxypeptidase regulatory-like domain-containing protein [Ignavibacteriae bacterium]|nr:carboxypeptidase regulatory-like domain-containing protein [Ignavibacteria bacterium]MBI3363760.1 carboxypeptidase regulatory-like domain-containing protein [Ignavibacteriota bacterium]